MSATTVLRHHLTERGIKHEDADLQTWWIWRNVRWMASEMPNGALLVSATNLKPADVLNVAANVTNMKHDVDGAIGHTTCGECGYGVHPSDFYCSTCGAELRGGWYDG